MFSIFSAIHKRYCIMFDRFYVSGYKTLDDDKVEFIKAKYTFPGAIRLAKKLEKKGWYKIIIMDDESTNVIYNTEWFRRIM